MLIEFSKIHGCANDFIVVDRRREAAPVSPDVAIRWCDRNRGIGADGVLSVLSSSVAPLAMHVTNPDGSVAEMCGNGLRCVVRWAVACGLLPAVGGPVETGRGVLECVVESDGNVRIDMGRPILEPARVPVLLAGDRIVAQPIEIDGEPLVVTAVSMGNPHAVQLVDDVDTAPVAQQGPLIEHHVRFVRRVNAGFLQVLNRGQVRLRVYERGAGETLACGSGACAAVVAGIRLGLLDHSVDVQARGGLLTVSWAGNAAHVLMTGPATTVFQGDIDIPDLL
jgi:diaminopimelate epimerase